MSSSPRLDTLQPDPQRSPATSLAAPSPPSGDARLANLLTDVIRDRDDLRRELAATTKRAEKAERLLTTFTQPNSAPSGNGGPSSAILEYEARIEGAEIARDEAEARRRVLADNWALLDRHLQVLEIYASDARCTFSRMLLDGGNQLVLPNILHLQSTPLFTSQSAIHQPLSMPPPTHTSRHHIPSSSRSSTLRGSVPVTHSSAPFSNMPLPPPPNPKLYPHSNRVRPRANSTDGSAGVPGQPPAKKSRGERTREYDGDRRPREDRAMYTESPIESPHLHVAQTQPYRLSPQFSNPPPPLSAQTAHSIHIQHRTSDLDREEYHQRLRDQVNDHRHCALPHDSASHLNTVMRPGLLQPGGAHSDRRSRRHRHHPHSRSGSVGSRSSSRSSASSLSLDEMLLQATTGADNPDRRGTGNGPNGSVTGSVPALPPAALRQHVSYHKQRIPNSATHSDMGYPQPNSRLRPDSPLSDYRSHPSSRPRAAPHHQPQPTLMTGPGMNPEGGVGPLSQPGQVQTYQTHVFAPVVTGAPVKKNKFMGSASSIGGSSPVTPGVSPGSGSTANTSAAATGVTAEAVPQPTSFPPTNAQGQRICRQCGLPGRYKDGKCVEKWGPGPHGSGTVCDRCRKKMKRVERRGTLESQQNASHHSMSSVVPPPAIRQSSSHSRSAQLPGGQGSDRTMHRSDTILVPSASGQIGPGGTHLLSPESPYVLHDSPPLPKNARAPPPSPPAIATLDDGSGSAADVPTGSASQRLGPASRAQSRSNSRNGRPVAGGRRHSATPTIPSDTATNRPVVPSSSKRRSPLGSGPSRGSRSTGSSPRVVKAETSGTGDVDAEAEPEPDADAEPDVEAEAEVEANADAEVDAEAEPEADVDAEADADAELLEAVDAAEANSSGSHGASGWLKEEG